MVNELAGKTAIVTGGASGIGRAMSALDPLYGPRARVGVVGLGTGTLACYAQPGQRWRAQAWKAVICRSTAAASTWACT